MSEPLRDQELHLVSFHSFPKPGTSHDSNDKDDDDNISRARPHTLPFSCQVALAALPCLSSAGAATIRSRAEALFQRLSFLDGDSVWLLLIQTLDACSAHQNHTTQKQQQRRQNVPLSKRALDGGKVRAENNGVSAERKTLTRRTAGSVASAAPSGPPSGGPRHREGSGARRSGSDRAGDLWSVPEPPSQQEVALPGVFVAGAESSRRPAALLEMRSLFGDGREERVARECVPAAERLLASLRVGGATNEHM